ncbi:RagB/SusD family nutrient uptake outer membrane protein [Algoriphagus resistens]|uniref:RagB/SusD family nutrient uptake outer membrane protein n=1 Tax=Algoriphagus resistens TaxID=1750590 RepID=UPI000716B2EA|nr:RagB/SusD family nutrient uptake outer membrane protein [Algoriphagus resistens]
MKINYISILWMTALICFSSCQEYLDEKPEKSILVPSSAGDVQALLDYYPNLNQNSLLTFIISDDWETTEENWDGLSPWEQNAYLWKTEIFEPNTLSTDYIRIHNQIFTANVCLEVLDKLAVNEDISNLRGEALALRSRSIFELSLLFLPHPFSPDADDIRIPVRLKPEINSEPEILGIHETLEIVEHDLLEAFSLLSEKGAYRTRPDRISVQALLSRLYLYQQRWGDAKESGKYVIGSEYKLMDFHEMDSSSSYPFELFNSEMLLYGITSSFSVTASSATYINSDLYSRYGEKDLRRSLFFTLDRDSLPLFKGSYLGDYNLFTGISLSEVYLTLAESSIRNGELKEGLTYLNALGGHRYLDFEEWDVATSDEALGLVLNERRKELVFKGTRWMDMKRLRNLGDFDYPVREIRDEVFTLQAGNQFTLQLPALEIELESL